MSLKIVRQDITRIKADAIVNPTNEWLVGTGGTDGAIHMAAGAGLDKACKKIGRLDAGKAVMTDGYNLPAKHIIHTVGPVWRGGDENERETLAECYRNCLKLADESGCRTVAFPLISSGTFGFPKDEALNIADREIRAFLDSHEKMNVIIALYDGKSFLEGTKLSDDIAQFIDDNYVTAKRKKIRRNFYGETEMPDGEYRVTEEDFIGESNEILPDENADMSEKLISGNSLQRKPLLPREKFRVPVNGWMEKASEKADAEKEAENSLCGAKRFKPIKHKDDINASVMPSKKAEKPKKEISPIKQVKMEDLPAFSPSMSFFEIVDSYIQDYGWKDSTFYNKASISKQSFSKMKAEGYHPKKGTACACALALELSYDDALVLLKSAGYALSDSIKFDLVIKYCLLNKIYNIITVDTILSSQNLEMMGKYA